MPPGSGLATPDLIYTCTNFKTKLTCLFIEAKLFQITGVVITKYERICPLSSRILQKCTRIFQKRIWHILQQLYLDVSTTKYDYKAYLQIPHAVLERIILSILLNMLCPVKVRINAHIWS